MVRSLSPPSPKQVHGGDLISYASRRGEKMRCFVFVVVHHALNGKVCAHGIATLNSLSSETVLYC